MDTTRPGFSDNVAASLSSEGRGFSFELHHFYEWIRDWKNTITYSFQSSHLEQEVTFK